MLRTVVSSARGLLLATVATAFLAGDAPATGTPGVPGTSQAAKAAGPCSDKTRRYVDCGNGTVTDMVTGLIWLRAADCVVSTNWTAANQAAARLKAGDCNLTDGSSPGDWRLPTRAEWDATKARAVALGCTDERAPSLTNDAGNACLSAGPSSFTGVMSGVFWSSSSVEANKPLRAWFANLDHGFVGFNLLFTTFRVWPVRGGR